MSTEETITREKTGWTTEAEDLLKDWRNRAYACQVAYFMESEQCRRWHYYLGIPVVISSAVVGTSIFVTDLETNVRYATGAFSALAAILASLQTFLKFAEAANKSAVAGEWYSAIRRDIDQIMVLPAEFRGNPKKCLDGIRMQMDEAGVKTPELRERLWKKVAKAHNVNEPGLQR